MGRKKKPAPGLLPESTQVALAEEQPKAEQCLALLRAWSLDTPEAREKAANFIRLAKERVVELEAERKSVTGPLNEAVKVINSWFKPVREPYEQGAELMRARLSEKLLELETAVDKALATVQADPASAPAEVLAIAHASTEAPRGVSTPEIWDYEVLDEFAVPAEYRVVSHDRLKAAVKAGAREIPGVRVFRRLGLVVRK